MEVYELVEEFQSVWGSVPTGVVLERKEGARVAFGVYLKAGLSLQVYVSLSVGPRGGIAEEIIAIDPSARIVADRLVVYANDGGRYGEGLLLPLSALRREAMQTALVQRQARALELCRNAMNEFTESCRLNPLRPGQVRNLPSSSRSIRHVIFTGVPGLGRRGGGRRR